MNLRPTEWLEVILVVVGGAVAVIAGPNLSVTVPAVAIAGAGGIALGVEGLAANLRRSRTPPPFVEFDPLVGISNAFTAGPLGRQRVIAELGRLRREFFGSTQAPLDPAAERRLLLASREEFHRWVAQELSRLEEGS